VLADQHREALARSGIDPERAASRGYETITDKHRLADIRVTPAGRRVPGLLVPLLDVRGSTWGYQFKPDTPRMRGDREVKYETPTDQRNGLDVPIGVGQQLGDPSIPLWVTEGSKKADCAAAHGLCCVTLMGVWNWRGTNNLGGKVALPDWNDVALNGRRVIIAYDGDVQRKESVRAAMDALARYLAIRDARVEFLHLPDTDDKTGLDDYLVAHSVEELWKLVKPIAPQSRQNTPANRQPEPPKEPPPYRSINGAELLNDIRKWFTRFICVVDPGDYDILTLWTAHTHLARELYTTPRLLITSPIHESGKTTLLEHLQHLCVNPIQAAVISSEALLPRLLEQSLRTVLLDEVNRTLRKDKPGVEDLLAVINSGYRLGATRPVLVSAGNGEWQSRDMSTFAPVALAGNSPNLPDDTRSRMLKILLLPDIEDLSEESDWEFIEGDARVLAARLADWADSVRAAIKQMSVDLPRGCTRRARERWRPLKRVAVVAGGGWPDVVDVLIVANLAQEAAEREDGLRARPPGVALLADLYETWPADKGFVPTSDLLRGLVTHDPDYWGADSPYGKELTVHRFGRILSDAAKVTSQRPGGAGPRGFLRLQIEPVWKRLGLTPPKQSGESGESGESGDQQVCPDDDDSEKSQVTALTALAASTALDQGGTPQDTKLCCWDCGTPDELVDGCYCRECADVRLASSGHLNTGNTPGAPQSRNTPPVKGSSDE
jgi:hypothetical protein